MHRHVSDFFQETGNEEWLVYFTRSFRSFAVFLVSHEKTTHEFLGTYRYSGNVDVAFSFNCLGSRIELELNARKSAPFRKRLFGSAPLDGTVVVSGTPTALCTVQNSHEEGLPVIHLEDASPEWQLDAHRVRPKDVICPLYVFARNKGEILLEDYTMLQRRSKLALPSSQPKRHFSGSVRLFSDVSLSEMAPAIGVIVTVTELLVKDYYMRLRVAGS